MKRTTYILIGLLCIPIVLVFFLPLIFVPADNSSKGKGMDVIIASGLAPVSTEPFSNVLVSKEEQFNIPGFEGIEIVCSQEYSVSYPENWGQYISMNVEDSTLILTVKAPKKNASLLDGKIIVTAPAIKAVSTNHFFSVLVDGFHSDSLRVISRSDLALSNCKIVTLNVEPSWRNSISLNLDLDSTFIGNANVEAFSKLKVNAPSNSLIENLTWNVDKVKQQKYSFSVEKSSIGHFQWIAGDDDKQLEIISGQPLKIDFKK